MGELEDNRNGLAIHTTKQVIKPTYPHSSGVLVRKLLIQGTWPNPNTDGGKCETLLACSCGTTCLFCTSTRSAPSSACKDAPKLYALLEANKLLHCPASDGRDTGDSGRSFKRLRAAGRTEKKAGAEANYNVLVILELHFTKQAAGLVMTASLEI